MSKIQPSNFAQAKKEMEKMDAELVAKIPTEIDSKDAKHFHVALVKISTREGQVKNHVNVNVQQFHPRGFEKINHSFRFHGFTKLIVIHDPSQSSQPAKKQEPAKADEPVKTETDGEAKTDVLDPEHNEAVANGQEVVKNGTVDDLDAFANDYGVAEYPKSGNKDDKKKAISEWLSNTGI